MKLLTIKAYFEDHQTFILFQLHCRLWHYISHFLSKTFPYHSVTSIHQPILITITIVINTHTLHIPLPLFWQSAEIWQR